MLRNWFLVFCIAMVLCGSGCSAGPNHMWRTVDDWQNINYEKNPLATGFFTDIVPFYPVVKVLVAIPDIVFLNPIQFWVWDVWTGVGAAHVHKNPQGTKKPVMQPLGDTWDEVDR